MNLNIGVIGFGEVGQIFVKGLLEKTEQVFVYDILLEDKYNVLNKTITKLGAKSVFQIEELGKRCDLVFSLVNSSASEVVAKGGVYIDAAIMGTVATEQYQVPIMIAGDYSHKVEKILNDLGLNCQAIDQPNGAAASIKLLSSIFMKGLEALVLETMITAKSYKVSDEVMQSISTTINNNEFTTFVNALITTHMAHKNRRYNEVLYSSKLIEEARLKPDVTKGVISFFSNSKKIEVDQEIIKSKNVKMILDLYLAKSTI